MSLSTATLKHFPDIETWRRLTKSLAMRDVPLASVQAIYRHQDLSEDLVESLNPQCTLADVMADALEIGYPSLGSAR